MIAKREFLLHAQLESVTLDAWVESGWILPAADDGERRFSEADLARARLIRDLRDEFGINDEGIDVILDLVDQIHGLRRALGEMISSASAKPKL